MRRRTWAMIKRFAGGLKRFVGGFTRVAAEGFAQAAFAVVMMSVALAT